MLSRTLLSSLLFAFFACTSATTPVAAAPSKPRSIIFLIADGAGVAHFTVGKMVRGAQFQTGRFPYSGLVNTSPLENSIVADSAAAATAFATGVRVRYTAVSMDAAGNRLPTSLQAAEAAKKSTGLVTTTNFWDATTAAFAAHAATRYETETIIDQMVKSGAEIIVGGGATRFGKEGWPTLDAVAKRGGYSVVRTPAELDTVKGERVLAVFETQPQEVDFAEVRLPVLTRWAIERLSPDPDGFFLVVEHEGVDGASHANQTEKFIASIVSFDEAVGVALEFASARNDVLIIVAADHECGGLQILREKGTQMELAWATKSHTGEAVPVFAYGPGAELFTGLMNGEDLGKKINGLVR
jgi:alkaline phosphatase